MPFSQMAVPNKEQKIQIEMYLKKNQLIVTRFRAAKRYASIPKVTLLLLTVIFSQACQNSSEENTLQEQTKEHPNISKLRSQSAEFTPEIIQLNKNVYVAVGFDGSNASMVIGEQGVVIIDALRALGAAEKVAEEFQKITDKPVKALIYTHSHQDHSGGTAAFVGDSQGVKIIARAGFKDELQERSPVEPILKQRNARQFGRNLPAEEVINRGVAPGTTPTDRVGEGYIEPNTTFEDSMLVTLAGLDFELHAANGETNDQLFVWIPALETLFTGDNYYKSFPNLYAIRGSQYRDVKSWGESVQKMSTLPVEYLVPGHTRPLSGKALVHRRLKNYATAILSVYQQTIDAMNQGYTLQQTVDSVRLADSLRNQPNLQEFYGSVPWGVRSIFLHYVGWFDGNPTNLYPLSGSQEAKHIVELAGGEQKMFDQLNDALKEEHYQWGLRLADYLLQTDYEKTKVIEVKVKLLRALAAQQINAPARNYYLSYANELERNSE
ncbi:alkyl sulfatase BDS1-like metallo-beta-lactamase superfamily hydrolase [Catalinimonas alkaloidigena]|uniref:alkyl/aryl-sulfatase n=1 Tax=Catalinimonas alkaloidigena TaxID=1075417 RepID=UPI0024074701|nr:alkyl/aryl-sulfatase [Catalinimonas alkaloidigena]MDF9797803.1 alkyl sulfatase BDS1-like metallo-beta-lactamase superfamily hydrolase [Catalinimonas alkaloidigena]